MWWPSPRSRTVAMKVTGSLWLILLAGVEVTDVTVRSGGPISGRAMVSSLLVSSDSATLRLTSAMTVTVVVPGLATHVWVTVTLSPTASPAGTNFCPKG